MNQETQVKAWGISALILVGIAALVFGIQHFVGRFVDAVFEICVFYIPAVAIVLIFLYFVSKR